MIKPVSFLIGIPAAFALANAASISDFKISTFGKLSNLMVMMIVVLYLRHHPNLS